LTAPVVHRPDQEKRRRSRECAATSPGRDPANDQIKRNAAGAAWSRPGRRRPASSRPTDGATGTCATAARHRSIRNRHLGATAHVFRRAQMESTIETMRPTS
jgi:hypothetical protein